MFQRNRDVYWKDGSAPNTAQIRENADETDKPWKPTFLTHKRDMQAEIVQSQNDAQNREKGKRAENPYEVGSRAYEMYENNPYTYDTFTRKKTGWDTFVNAWGFRSGYDAALDEWLAAGKDYDAQLAEIDAADRYNSPEEQAARMRNAGQNADLLGTGNVAEAEEFANKEAKPNVNAPGQFEIADIISSIGKAFTFASGMTSEIFQNIGVWEDIKTKRTERGGKLQDLAHSFITNNWSDEIKDTDPKASEFDDQGEQLLEKAYSWAQGQNWNEQDAAAFANQVRQQWNSRKDEWYNWKNKSLKERDDYFLKKGNKYTTEFDNQEHAKQVLGDLISNLEDVLIQSSYRDKYKAENDAEFQGNRSGMLEQAAIKGEAQTKVDKAALISKARDATEKAIKELEQSAEQGDILSIALISALADIQIKVLE